MSSKKSFWTLSGEILAKEINVINLVHKSEMGMKVKYKLINNLHNHNTRGCDCLRKVTDAGTGLQGNHFQEGKFQQGNQQPGLPDPKSGWLRFFKRDAINPNPEGEGTENGTNMCQRHTMLGARDTVLAAVGTAPHLILVTVLRRQVISPILQLRKQMFLKTR